MLTRHSIIFVHGLRGHPQYTWEDDRNTGREATNSTPSKREKIRSLFRRSSSVDDTGASVPTKLFWPKEFLTEDIPDARVWTYGYNADVIGGLFQANNQNSVSQHSQDLAVRIEQEIETEVISKVARKSST